MLCVWYMPRCKCTRWRVNLSPKRTATCMQNCVLPRWYPSTLPWRLLLPPSGEVASGWQCYMEHAGCLFMFVSNSKAHICVCAHAHARYILQLFFSLPSLSLPPLSAPWIILDFPRNSCHYFPEPSKPATTHIPTSLHKWQCPMDTALLLALSLTLSQNSPPCCFCFDSAWDAGLCH